MKPKNLIIGSTILLIGAILIIYLSKNQSLFQKEYPVSVESTAFSTEGAGIKMGMTGSQATKDTLTLNLTLSGIDLGENPAQFDHLVCDPRISTKENVEVTFKSREVFMGDPVRVTYTYQLQGNTNRTLNVDMDWTIGPCDIALDESNVTPVPQPLLTNTHFTFAVPVK
jgi:hypothetical protein